MEKLFCWVEDFHQLLLFAMALKSYLEMSRKNLNLAYKAQIAVGRLELNLMNDYGELPEEYKAINSFLSNRTTKLEADVAFYGSALADCKDSQPLLRLFLLFL